MVITKSVIQVLAFTVPERRTGISDVPLLSGIPGPSRIPFCFLLSGFPFFSPPSANGPFSKYFFKNTIQIGMFYSAVAEQLGNDQCMTGGRCSLLPHGTEV